MRLPVQQAPPQPTKTLPPPPPPIKLQEPIKESPRKLFGRKNKAVQAPPPPPPPPAPVAPPVEQHRNRCGPHSHLHSSSSRLLEAVPAEHPQPLHFRVGHSYQRHAGDRTPAVGHECVVNVAFHGPQVAQQAHAVALARPKWQHGGRCQCCAGAPLAAAMILQCAVRHLLSVRIHECSHGFCVFTIMAALGLACGGVA